MKISLLSVVALLVFALSVHLQAADEVAKKPRKKAAGTDVIGQLEKKIADLELSDEQRDKAKQVLADFKPKFEELKSTDTGLTAEQKKAQKEAAAKAKADGQKGKARKEAIEAAVNLSDEQKKSQAESAEKLKDLQVKLKTALTGVLPADQVEKLNLGGKKTKKNS